MGLASNIPAVKLIQESNNIRFMATLTLCPIQGFIFWF